MPITFFRLKNYLYKKNNVKFIVPVLAVFLCTSCLSSVVKHKGFSTEIKDKTLYDMPPTAPIPPEKYCFEQSGAGKAELFVIGDSVYCKIDGSKTGAAHSAEFRGIMLGSTLIVSCKLQTDSGLTSMDQKWRFVNDSLYQLDTRQATDSNASKEETLQSHFSGSFHKVACR